MTVAIYLLERVAAALIPSPRRWPDQWADQCRILPPGKPEPGPFRSDRTPYMRPIVRAIASTRFRKVVVCCGAQLGKTSGLLNVLGARLDDAPVATIYVGPTKSFIETQLEPDFSDMVRNSPSLVAKMGPGKASNLKTRKVISGVVVRLAWAGSAVELSSMSAGLALVDEYDRMVEDVAGEGDPIEMIVTRGSNFPDFTLVVTSTPLVGNVETTVDPVTGIEHWAVADPEDVDSPTWRLWQEGSRHEWAWPCPECGEYFVPRLCHLKWPSGVSVTQAAHAARMCCPRCGAAIEDVDKSAMNAAGRFLAPGQWIDDDGSVCGGEPEGTVASFWVSGLCSPWKTWADRAERYLRAVRSGSPRRVKTVINTDFGELYRSLSGEERPWEAVAALREGYGFDEVPAAARILTAGVDVQSDRLYFVVRAWGARHESWLVRHGALYGDTDDIESSAWRGLEDLLLRDFSGRRIGMMAVDSGFNPNAKTRIPDHAVYLFARKHGGLVRATKGHATQAQPVKRAKIDITVNGRTLENGLFLWHVDSNYMKGWVTQRLGWTRGDPGSFHLPADATDDYCRQLTAERRIVKPSGQATWVRVRRANHYLDCEALAFAAATMMKVHEIPDDAPVSAADRPAPPKQARRQTQVRRRQWIDRSWSSGAR